MGSGHPKALMRNCLCTLVILICVACISSCANISDGREQPKPTGIIVEGIIIRNELAFPVTDVMINVPATGAFAGCGNIMARSACRTTFEAVDYYANKMVISWREYGQPHQTGEFVMKQPDNLDPGRAAWVEVSIFSMGQAGARLIQ